MYKWLAIIVFVSCFSTNEVSVAQTSLESPSQIHVPQGYTLVETPAVFKSIRTPVLKNASSVYIAPTYTITVKNGVRIRKEVVPAKRTDGLTFGPFKTQSTRKAVQPIGFALKNETGDIIKKWKWFEGKLVTVK